MANLTLRSSVVNPTLIKDITIKYDTDYLPEAKHEGQTSEQDQVLCYMETNAGYFFLDKKVDKTFSHGHRVMSCVLPLVLVL